MLSTLSIFFYIFFLSLSFGLILKKIFIKLFNLEEDSSAIPLSILLLGGLSLISVIGQFYHIFASIGLSINLILIVSSVLYLFIDRKFVENELRQYFDRLQQYENSSIIITSLLAFVFLGLALYQSSSITLSADTPLYHSLAIKYIEQHPVIPGLGNLYDRLAYNNSWFIPNAIFNLSFLGKMQFNVLGTFFLLFGGIYFLSGFINLLNKNYSIASWIKILFIPVLLYSYYYPHLGYTSSPTPDIPASLFTWIIFIEYIIILEKKKKLEFGIYTLLLGFLSFFLLTVKLSAALMIIPTIYIFFKALKLKKTKEILIASALYIIVLMPWLIHNYYLSGYLIHPFPSIDIFNPDWKFSYEEADHMKQVIQDWAKWPGWFQKPAGLKLADTSFMQWFDIWMRNQTVPQFKAIFYAIPVLWVLSFIVLTIRKKINGINKLDLFIILISIIAGYLFWFKSAPDIRFGWGYIFSSMFTFLVIILYFSFENIKININKHLLTSVLSFGILYSVYLHYDAVSGRINYFNKSKNNDYMLIPNYIPMVYGVNLIEIDGNDVYTAPNPYDLPLPGSNKNSFLKQVEYRGSGLEDGFRRVKNKQEQEVSK